METTVIEIGSSFRKARKPHECICGGTIKKGTRYERKVALVDGAIEVTKEADHIHAHEVADWAENAYWERKMDEARDGDSW